MTKNLNPILKWAGGKERELKFIIPEMPKAFERFFEPFVGGGAVYFNIGPNHEKLINDKSHELIDLYLLISKEDKKFFLCLEEIIEGWDLIREFVLDNTDGLKLIFKKYRDDRYTDPALVKAINKFLEDEDFPFDKILSKNCAIFKINLEKEIKKSVLSKIRRMKKLEIEKSKLPEQDITDNIEGAIKAGFYTHIRYLYNNRPKIEKELYASTFFFLRNYCYSGMFRYNTKGGFNVPYGGIAYNSKGLIKKYKYMRTKELVSYLKETKIYNLDFIDFFNKGMPKKNDFIFLDPPYDTEFSTYAENIFNQNDQVRLANYLIKECPAKWMLVIKNTPFILSLYDNKRLEISSFAKKYLVSFKNRNDKDAEHLIIKNY